MKKAISLILCLIFILTLTACRNNKDTSSADITSSRDSDKVSSVAGSKDDTPKVESAKDEISLDSAPEKTTEIVLEGTTEEIRVRAFQNEYYTVWIDTKFFYVPSESAEDQTVVTIKGRYDEKASVNMIIMRNKFGIEHGTIRYKNFAISNYYDVGEITDAVNPKIPGTKHMNAKTSEEGLKQNYSDEILSIYCVPISENESYTIVLTYPNGLQEGYGARLEQIYDSIEYK